MDHKFKEDTEWFVRQIESRKRLLPTFAHAAGMLFKEVNKDFDKFIDEHAYDKTYDEAGDLVEFGVPEDFSGRYNFIKKPECIQLFFRIYFQKWHWFLWSVYLMPIWLD